MREVIGVVKKGNDISTVQSKNVCGSDRKLCGLFEPIVLASVDPQDFQGM